MVSLPAAAYHRRQQRGGNVTKTAHQFSTAQFSTQWDSEELRSPVNKEERNGQLKGIYQFESWPTERERREKS